MISLLVTYHPVFHGAAMSELRAVDPGAALLRQLDPSVAHVESSCSETEFRRRLRDALPIFVRHVAPVHVEAGMEGARDPMQTLVDALDAAPRLDPGATFAVQCRKLGGPGKGVPFGARDVEVRLGRHLEAMGCRVDMEAPVQAVSVAISGWCARLGVSLVADNLSPRADEQRRRSRQPTPVSRAEFKLREALETWAVPLPAGGRALDVGAAPGGWTHVLAGEGLRVTAVDPGTLAELVAADPLVTHLRARLDAAGLAPAAFDLLVNDMNLDPEESAALMCRAAAALSPGAPAIMTIKVPVRQPLRIVRRTLTILQLAYELRGLRNLHHNRQEVTACLRRRPDVAPGWEALLGHDRATAVRRRDWDRDLDTGAGAGAIPLVLREPPAA